MVFYCKSFTGCYIESRILKSNNIYRQIEQNVVER